MFFPRRPSAAADFPKEQAKILDTWHTLGMRGTGATDFAVQDLFVPDHLTAPVCPLAKPAPGFEGPLFRMWPWTAIMGEATVSVGVAAAAVDEAVELCRTKTAAYNTVPLREGRLTSGHLRQVQRRRELATRITQRLQLPVQERVIARVLVLGGAGELPSPLALRLMARFPFLERLLARMVGIGVRPEHPMPTRATR